MLLATIGTSQISARDWPHWRGPNQNGTSNETGLISTWALAGENLIWQADFIGRSTPVIMNGRVYVIGRAGTGLTRQEQVACYEAQTGKMIWEHRFNVFQTTVPFNRVGWANLAGDPETGNVYAHGVGGMFICYNRNGKILWQRSLTEEFGRFSGYGGRTHTPVVDENLVIISFLNTGWGEHAAMRHRFVAFDKRTGEIVWIATLPNNPYDTNYSTPAVATINGVRLLIVGGGDGAVHALKVRTGEHVWQFKLSKAAINPSIVVDGTRVFACHSEENLDNVNMGRVVCIDGTGSGDVIQTHEVWRADNLEVGYCSPALHGGMLYLVDNSANLFCLDAKTGNRLWQYNLGTVGKGSPVVADGKIYVTEQNGVFHILQPSAMECKSLDTEKLTMPDGRYAELYGSPAIAYGRIYFTAESGLYCLGDKNKPFTVSATVIAAAHTNDSPAGAPAFLQIVPAEILAQPGEKIKFRARVFDAKGNFVREVKAAWSLANLSGQLGAAGELTVSQNSPATAGHLTAKFENLEGQARVRVIPAAPWKEDFESSEIGKYPAYFVGASNKFGVQLVDGNKVLVKPPAAAGLNRSDIFLGPPTMKNYTIQADMLGKRSRRQMPDMGLIANRYTLDLQGALQRLQIRVWAAELLNSKTIDFKFEPDVWYTMKMRVDQAGGKSIVKGKVWPRAEKEPEAWTITMEDPLPNPEGSPGLYGYSPVEIYYDNVKITKSN
ncbi:MAG: PQQ-binding-like beta-propeller repeat protein [candidate division KSB1 bacterium]|nr:PQQ-binding-like beta-propeller repeat protein [candidate division KSB1 bacterium]MDZ7366640.1 PQQ-binding-like beta-propeller repeat protein [candidate division KSB1 bacterium]MDZ7404651.1 PQQ-binding-like beta-propeller repeat protein [candidate division KSB1 bacterium]